MPNETLKEPYDLAAGKYTQIYTFADGWKIIGNNYGFQLKSPNFYRYTKRWPTLQSAYADLEQKRTAKARKPQRRKP